MDNMENSIPESQQDLAEQYRQLFEEAPIAYHELNRYGIVQRVSNEECRLLGYSREEMVGHHICDFVPPKDRRDCAESFLRKIEGNFSSVTSRRCYRRKDNRDIVVEIHDQLLRNGSGDIIGTRTALFDVTEKVEEESALQENQLWFLDAIQSMNEPIIAMDTLGIVTLVNVAAEKLVGRTEDALVGRPLMEAVPSRVSPREPSLKPYSPLIGLTETWYGTSTFRTEAGEERCVEVTTAPILSAGGDCIGIVLLSERL